MPTVSKSVQESVVEDLVDTHSALALPLEVEGGSVAGFVAGDLAASLGAHLLSPSPGMFAGLESYDKKSSGEEKLRKLRWAELEIHNKKERDRRGEIHLKQK